MESKKKSDGKSNSVNQEGRERVKGDLSVLRAVCILLRTLASSMNSLKNLIWYLITYDVLSLENISLIRI